MEQVDMIGIDLAKNSFQVHGARADGSVAFRPPRVGHLCSAVNNGALGFWKALREV